jgi:hypothetical protein
MAMQKRPPGKITAQEMDEALKRSGYLLESRIEAYLDNRHYHVQASAPVADPVTGKSRELDLYAIGETDFSLSVHHVMLIECVNNSQPFAFITKEQQHLAAFDLPCIKMAGIPAKLWTADGDVVSLPHYLMMTDYHHYCKDRISTQWCSFSPKDKGDAAKGWMASHDDIHFDDLAKLCDSVEFFIGRRYATWTPAGQEYVNLEFYYPILVLQNDVYDVQFVPGSGIRVTPTHHIRFRRSALVGAKEARYHIDVITEGFFPSFCELLEKEMDETRRRLTDKKEAIERAIGTILGHVLDAKSNTRDVRAAMEYREDK